MNDLAREVDTGSGLAVEVVDGLSLAPVWQTATAAGADRFFVQAADLSEAPGLELLADIPLDEGNLVTGEAPGQRLWEITYTG